MAVELIVGCEMLSGIVVVAGCELLSAVVDPLVGHDVRAGRFNQYLMLTAVGFV